MEIWLSSGTKDKLKIPVNPQSIGKDKSQNFEDIVLASGDEKTIAGGKNLAEYEIESFFPKNKTFYAERKLSMPVNYVKKLEKWMEARTVLLLQVTTTGISKQVTIRSFNWSESGGAVGDIDYTLSLKEYSPISYAKVTGKKKPTAPGGKRPPSSKPTAKTHTVVKGDSLWKIAKKYYGNSNNWRKIYEANKKVVGSNPNRIYPGQRLVIPA